MLSGQELSDLASTHFDSIVDARAIPSWDLTVTDMLAISTSVRTAIDAGHQSIVVIHGTDTMEESAWLTDLLLGSAARTRCRVLFTGAMRFADSEESDGPANLSFALQHALETSTPNQGVQVAFGGELHAARWVRKVDALSLNPFSSGNRPSSSQSPPMTNGEVDSAVSIVLASSIFRQPMPPRSHGIVLYGTGAGHVPSHYFKAIEGLWARGVPVVLASRARDVPRPFDAGQCNLWAADLTPEKAALALMAALAVSRELDDICTWWSELMAGSIR